MEALLGKAGHDRIFKGDDIGRAWFAVQCRQFADLLSPVTVLEGHFAAREGKINNARTTLDDEVKVATVALPVDNQAATSAAS